ncbi:coenzyme F390 synthetase [Petrotoga mobilis SJ95]|uniref:Coenzyme F390 synthetase n=1 Tax=Petrotoga mobilis (strain DSM 10674 / SJ95) TaxID=403833 RepID=A9BEU7_PETMO|nr:phenylacetate--CoA ligase family protein [Petrotoga mobilis]ABX30825.1 coenzyme F390 synthetase [Petrotoga mobilis SJ95]
MSFLTTVHYYYSLRKNLNYSRKKILALREKKFRKLLKYAYKKIPFYKDFYTSNGIKESMLEEIPIYELPTINKNLMVANFDKFFKDNQITKNKVEDFLKNNPNPTSLLFNKYHVIHSSGSTGTVGYYLYSEREWDFIKAISTRMFSNFTLKRKKYVFIGAVDGHYAAISLFFSPLNQPEKFFYKGYMVMDINKPIKSYLKDLNDFQPDNLTGYPFGIRSLAQFQNEGILNIHPEVIVCGGEPLLKNVKQFLKDVWKDTEIVDSYATSESLAMGVSREDLKGMYIYDDAVYLEIQEDKTILTNLYNYTQPIIRYELTDILKKSKDNKGKWPFTKIEQITGRNELIPFFINENGEKDFIHPIVIAEFFVKGVAKFQFVQKDQSSFVFKIVVSQKERLDEIVKEVRNKLNDILEKKKMQNVNFDVKIVEDIKPDEKTGKYKLIVI